MPTKSDDSSVECYGFYIIAARPRGGIKHSKAKGHTIQYICAKAEEAKKKQGG